MNKIRSMKVLNVAQPNAHNIIFNGKNVENRSRRCTFRGTIAIYASKTLNLERFSDNRMKLKPEACSYGCIIGFVDITDSITSKAVTRKTKKWFSGKHGYVFENVVKLKQPIKVSPPKGAVIWWQLKGRKLRKCLKQISPAKLKRMSPAE